MHQTIKVLVVDDSSDDRFFFCRALIKTGLKVQIFEVEDGDEAIDFLNHERRFRDPQEFPCPDLVFLDLKMPGRNGFDVLRWLQEQGRESAFKIVVLSGSELDMDIHKARALGVASYLVKPASPDQLRELISVTRDLQMRG